VPGTLFYAIPEKGDLKMPRTCLKIGHLQNHRKIEVGRDTRKSVVQPSAQIGLISKLDQVSCGLWQLIYEDRQGWRSHDFSGHLI